jgi:hypothetical protein
VADSYGIEVERRRREIAAHHGVPDFVFRPANVPKGNAQREVGDFLLWVGDVVAIVASKSRDPSAAANESQDRRRRWFESNVDDACGQIRGVARRLRESGSGKLTLESERGRRVDWDPSRVAHYVGVVVIDAPPPDEDYGPDVAVDGVPTIVMLADDWDFLNETLPSTMAVIRYVARRQARVPRCPVGAERDVLALIIEEMHTGNPIEIPDAGLEKGQFNRLLREHPDWLFGTSPDDRFASIIDAMIEGASDADPELSDASDPNNYLHITEFLDRIPLLDRIAIGKGVLERCERVGNAGGRVTSRLPAGDGMLIFVTDSYDRADRAAWLRQVTFARHSQALDAGAPASLTTLGVATQPVPTEARAHDFVVIRGAIRSDPEFRARRDEAFGDGNMSPLVERWTRGAS